MSFIGDKDGEASPFLEVGVGEATVGLTEEIEPGVDVDVVVDKDDRAVSHADLHTTGMVTTGRLKGMVAATDAAEVAIVIRRVALTWIVPAAVVEGIPIRYKRNAGRKREILTANVRTYCIRPSSTPITSTFAGNYLRDENRV